MRGVIAVFRGSRLGVGVDWRSSEVTRRLIWSKEWSKLEYLTNNKKLNSSVSPRIKGGGGGGGGLGTLKLFMPWHIHC